MKREIEKISSEVQDVLIVGGGIHGAAIACHAARAGYRTAILDKGDFCGATSANSLKIIHGGLRYLQHGNIKRMRHSIVSRREMMTLAPHLVQPLPCLMPLYGNGLRGRTAMRAALFLNDCIGWDRNRGVAEKQRLPGGYIASRKKCLEVVPGIDDRNLKGAAVWHDALAVDTERLVLEYILEGVRYGAGAANYVEVASVEDDGETCAATLRDRMTDREYRVRARFVVNASGPWLERCCLPAVRQNGPQQQWSLALNLVSRKQIFRDYAVALEGQASYHDRDALLKRDKRLYFFVPWRGHTMIGTEYEVSRTDPDRLEIGEETVRKMVGEINAIYPRAGLEYGDISFYHAGLLPMQSPSAQAGIQLVKNSTLVRNGKQGRIITLRGVKYTTAPYIAGEVVGILRKMQVPGSGRPGREAASQSGEWEGIDPAERALLETRYGRRAAALTGYMDAAGSKNFQDHGNLRLLGTEVRYLIDEEMALTLADIVFRRTGLGTAECPPPDLLREIAAYMGEILGWNQDRQTQEIDAVRRRYAPLAAAAQ